MPAAPALCPKEFLDRADALNVSYSLPEAEAYTRWLATHHYENFHVVTFLLPKSLHQDFYNVYAFCRWADDLGDEIGDHAESLRLLAWWREELHSMYEGQPRHPVFVALEGTAYKYGLPVGLFDDLIHAFEHDQTVSRYRDWDEVFDYCRYSANPVGRLVLRLCGYADEARDRLSDATCTALQLANFWQDVTIDLQKDRIYLPLHLFGKYGYTEAELQALKFTPAFRSVMRDAVGVARELFVKGMELPDMVNRRLKFDLQLFNRGGMCVLDKIEAQDYNVLARRPAVSKLDRVLLMFQAAWSAL